MKQIKQEQIDSILKVLYEMNLSAKSYDEMKKFFDDLPVCNCPKEEK
jgi:hypothetical protein